MVLYRKKSYHSIAVPTVPASTARRSCRRCSASSTLLARWLMDIWSFYAESLSPSCPAVGGRAPSPARDPLVAPPDSSSIPTRNWESPIQPNEELHTLSTKHRKL